MTNNSGYQEASDMLADALKQMDGLLADTLKREHSHQTHHTQSNGVTENDSPKNRDSPKRQQSQAVSLLNDLRVTLEGVDDQEHIFRQLSPDTRHFLEQWMKSEASLLNNGYSNLCDGPEDKIRRLETDREDLSLQVSVLSDQIEAQVEKIRDLERTLKLSSSHVCRDNFTTELLNRASSAQDTHKLDLMAENSNLKLRLAASDREKSELQSRLEYAQKRIDDLQSRLNDQTIEVAELRSRAAKNGTIPSSPDPSDAIRDRTLERERTLDRLKRKHSEVEKLKRAVESLMVTNSEKDGHIEDLKHQVKRYRRIEDLILSAQGQRGMDHLSLEDDRSDSSSTHNSNLSGNETVREVYPAERYDNMGGFHPDLRPGHLIPTATSTPVNNVYTSPKNMNSNQMMTPPSTINPNLHTPSPKKPLGGVGIGRSSSYEDVKPQAGTPPTLKRPGQAYGGTLPKDARLLPLGSATTAATMPSESHRSPVRDTDLPSRPRPRASTLPKGKPPIAPNFGLSSGPQTPSGSLRRTAPERSDSTRRTRGSGRSADSSGGSSPANQPPTPRKQRSFMSFGKGLFKMRSGRWSSSAPNLAQTETDEETLKDEMAQQYKRLQKQGQPQPRKHKNKGIKRFFGKLRRSNSQDFDQDQLEDFKRSGLRSTAGPRLGWTRDMKTLDDNTPFERWDRDRIATWLHGLGLSMYVGECKRWLKNGEQLLKASNQDFEKELGMRSYFHRKKLHLMLQVVKSETRSPMDELDFNWVIRWLDDIGLPQYKDQFSDARIDGRMLHCLTVEELVSLKVTNSLHHLSIKQAIQVLRDNSFNAACLKRRPVPEEGVLQNVPKEVVLWTNHRVMEWLRSIDLSEYAPNLRGSGVHGALMVMETKFTTDILASLLLIPGNKTLLRRHLSTHYITLIGNEIQQKKREIQAQTGYIPLTPNQKVKLKKRLFGHKRTRCDGVTVDEELLCPCSSEISADTQPNGGPVWRDGTLTRGEDKENMLARDRFLDDVPTSDV